MGKIPNDTLLDGETGTNAGESKTPWSPQLTFQASGRTTAGAGSATVIIEGHNQDETDANADWLTLGTITLSFTTADDSDGFAINAPWRKIRARVSAIAGTNASVDAMMAGVQ